VGNFIDDFMSYTANAESPSSYFRWAAYSCVSAVMRDNFYVTQELKKIMPNMYVLLHGDSGQHRKGAPTGLATELIRQVGNTKVISGRSSIQAVMKCMAEPEQNRATGKPILGGSIFLCADELSSFFVNDPALIPMLTDIYDYKALADHRLVGSGTIWIKNRCVSLLMGSNEAMLREVYSNLAIHGGLLARTFFVKPDEARKPNSAFGKKRYDGTELSQDISEAELVTSLKAISEVERGEMFPTEKAWREYDLWYKSIRERVFKSPDKTGVLSRIHTGVIKLSMVLCLAESLDREISLHHVQEAIDRCLDLLPNYEVYAISGGDSSISSAGAKFLSELLNSSDLSVTNKEFLRKHWMDVPLKVLNDLTTTLEAAGIIKAEIVDSMAIPPNVKYTLTKTGLEKVKQRREK